MAERAKDRESEQIRENIERTRSRMDQTIRALDSKMSVGQIMDQVLGVFRGSPDSQVRNSSRYVIDAVRENPVPAAMVGAGLAWLLYEQSRGPSRGAVRRWPRVVGEHELEEGEQEPGLLEQGKSKLAETKQRLGEKFDELRQQGSHGGEHAREVGGQAKAKVGELGDQARAKASEMTDRAREAGSEAIERARHLKDQGRQRVYQARDELRHQVDENPLAVGAAAFALGLIGGLFLPPTRREAELLGQPASQLRAGLREAGEEAQRGWQQGGAQGETSGQGAPSGPDIGEQSPTVEWQGTTSTTTREEGGAPYGTAAPPEERGPWAPTTEPPGTFGGGAPSTSGPTTGRILSGSGTGLVSQPVDPTRPSDDPSRGATPSAVPGAQTPLPGMSDPLTEAERRRAELLDSVNRPDEPWRKR